MGSLLKIWLPVLGTRTLMAAEFTLITFLMSISGSGVIDIAVFGFIYTVFVAIESPIMMLDVLAVKYSFSRESQKIVMQFSLLVSFLLAFAITSLMISATFSQFIAETNWIDNKIWVQSKPLIIILTLSLPFLGYRRYKQGVFIKNGQGQYVLNSLFIKTFGFIAFTMVLVSFGRSPYESAALGLFTGIVAESLYSLCIKSRSSNDRDDPITYQQLAKELVPLSLMSFSSLAISSICVFALSASVDATTNIAIFTLAFGLTMILKSVAISFQSILVSTLSGGKYDLTQLKKLFLWSMVTSTIATTMFFALFSNWYFVELSMVAESAIHTAVLASSILALSSVLTFPIIWVRGHLIAQGKNKKLSLATLFEISGVVLVIFFGINMHYDIVAVCAFSVFIGRVLNLSYMIKEMVFIPSEKAGGA